MKTKLNITGVQPLKSGVNPKTQKAWTLFKYTIDSVLVDKEAYTSFTSFSGHENGEQEIDLEVNVNGQWKNLREVSAQSPLGKKLADLEKRVKALEDARGGKGPTGDGYDDIPVINDSVDF